MHILESGQPLSLIVKKEEIIFVKHTTFSTTKVYYLHYKFLFVDRVYRLYQFPQKTAR